VSSDTKLDRIKEELQEKIQLLLNNLKEISFILTEWEYNKL
jgi:hypothetical protein